MSEKPWCDLYTIDRFMVMCKSGYLIDYDGVGYFGTETTESEQQVSCKDLASGTVVPDPKHTHVHWYNR